MPESDPANTQAETISVENMRFVADVFGGTPVACTVDDPRLDCYVDVYRTDEGELIKTIKT